MDEKIDKLAIRIAQLQHAMQSGVAMVMNYNNGPTAPKHLRTGVNVALVSNGALVSLLVKKGIITQEEYYIELVSALEDEVKNYEDTLTNHFGSNVTLG